MLYKPTSSVIARHLMAGYIRELSNFNGIAYERAFNGIAFTSSILGVIP